MARDSLRLVSRNGLTWLESTTLSRFRWLAHGFSTRLAPPQGSDGAIRQQRQSEFNLGLTPDTQPATVERNRRMFREALGSFAGVASLSQVHSALVYQVGLTGRFAQRRHPDGLLLRYRPAGWPLPMESGEAGPVAAQRGSPSGDALVTGEAGVLLTVRIADCLPVLIVDRRLRLVAAIHAGWRGALARIVETTVGELRRIFGSNPQDQLAVFGPGIGRCCYEVGDEVVDAFTGQFVHSDSFFCKPTKEGECPRTGLHTLLFHTQAPPGHARPRPALRLDLQAVARAQLVAAGLKPSAVYGTGYCTACRSDLFFSHRREGTRAGRMVAAIGIRQRPAAPEPKRG